MLEEYWTERSRLPRKCSPSLQDLVAYTIRDDMKEMFEFPLRRTYELLLEQMMQARRSGAIDIKVCVTR
jgi:hypothetical protein